jgi:hypothetical protein
MKAFNILVGGLRMRPGLDVRISAVAPETTPEIDPENIVSRFTVRETFKIEDGAPVPVSREVLTDEDATCR